VVAATSAVVAAWAFACNTLLRACFTGRAGQVRYRPAFMVAAIKTIKSRRLGGLG
jgi:hypothetical protein